MEMYRQGDVLLKRSKAMPKGLQRSPDPIVALGEVTGHAHRITGDAVVFVDPTSQQLWVQVMSTATLIHDEHQPVTLERGVYEVVRQREYTPESIQRVLD